ncbi:hypothetical protein D3C72_1689620 [compost metagenome]
MFVDVVKGSYGFFGIDRAGTFFGFLHGVESLELFSHSCQGIEVCRQDAIGCHLCLEGGRKVGLELKEQVDEGFLVFLARFCKIAGVAQGAEHLGFFCREVFFYLYLNFGGELVGLVAGFVDGSGRDAELAGIVCPKVVCGNGVYPVFEVFKIGAAPAGTFGQQEVFLADGIFDDCRCRDDHVYVFYAVVSS